MSDSITLKVNIRGLILHVKRDRNFIWLVKDDPFEVFLIEYLLDFFLRTLRGWYLWLHPKTLLLSQIIFIE
jgi:hypothetical protein